MKKVIVGMSGGVDSSVAALLLKEEGYEVIGVTLNIWQDDVQNTENKSCGSNTALQDAKAVCDKLGIEHKVLDFKKEFKEKVIDYFANEYMDGRTPNPCNMCNRYIKFEALLNKAIEMGVDYIATGHYAKIDKDKETERYYLTKSDAIEKDQTYALYDLTQDQLSHVLMPLGKYTKNEVREIAVKNDLVTAKKKESQDICFIPDNDHTKFISEKYNYTPKQGNFVLTNGKILGKHKGIIKYTIGQRKGLGISYEHPLYVTKINKQRNEVVLGDLEELYSKELTIDKVNFMYIAKLEKEMEVEAKIRYSAKPAKATIYPIENGKVRVVFEEKQKSVTPGQSVVFYLGNILVGGGTII